MTNVGKNLAKLNWLQAAVLDNFGYKVISIALAVILWIFVVVEKQPEIGFIVPITFRHVPRNMTLADSMRNYEVEVRAKGPQALINNLSSRQFTLELNLSQSRSGDIYFTLLPQDIKAPRGIRVIRVLPSQLKVTLEPLLGRVVPIEPVILGATADGYELRQINVFPPNVKIQGPRSKVEGLRTIRTTPLNITGLSKSITQKVDLVLSENVELVDAAEIEVRAIIREKNERKIFYNIPIQVTPPTRGAAIEPKYVTATLVGPISTIRNLKLEQIVVSVNLQQLKPDEDEVQIQVELPEQVSLTKLDPRSVKIVNRGEEDKLLRPHLGVMTR